MYKLYAVYGCEWPFYFEASKEKWENPRNV